MALTKVSSGLISADASSVDLNIDAGTLYIDATNNRVGIGTSSPSVPLHILGSHTVYGAELSTSSTATTSYNVMRFTQGTGSGAPTGYIGTGGSAVGNSGFAGAFGIGTQTSAQVTFLTNDTERMRIDSSGNVRIGATTGFHKVCIAHDDSFTDIASGYTNLELSNPNGTNGTYSRIVFNDAAGGPGSGILGVKFTDTTNNYGQFEFWTRSSSGGSTKMVIDPNGNVGIGTTSPATKLNVQQWNSRFYKCYLWNYRSIFTANFLNK
jgi:hypothetical protein